MVTNIRLSGVHAQWRSESDIRFNYNNLLQIIGACNSPGNQEQFDSSDGGVTWNNTSLPTVPGDSLQGDPCVDWTSDGTAWALTVGAVGTPAVAFQVRCFKSTSPPPPTGRTWTSDSTVSGTQNNVDKPILWIDHSPTSPHLDNMYALWWNATDGATYIARRAGPAGAWLAPQQISGTETTGGSDGGDIKTNTFGDVFAFWPSESNNKLFVAKSTDGAANFSAPVLIATTSASFLYSIPADQRQPTGGTAKGALLYISGAAYRTATQDSVYACWMDLAGGSGCNSAANEPGTNVNSPCTTRIWFSRSTDGGATWETPRKINDQTSTPLHDQFFPRLALDETSGNMMVIYYDTVSDSGRVKTDIWMQNSADSGVTWTTASKITTAQTDETSAGHNTNYYGDYIGLTGFAGQFFGCWTDRRPGGSGFEEIWGASIPGPQLAVNIAWKGRGGDHFLNVGPLDQVNTDGKLSYDPFRKLLVVDSSGNTESSSEKPALAIWTEPITSPLTPSPVIDHVLIAWKGDTNNNLNLRIFDDPQSKYIFNSPHPTETSDKAPSLARGDINTGFGIFGFSWVYMAWKGEGEDFLNIAPINVDPTSPTKLSYDPSKKTVIGLTTNQEPATAPGGVLTGPSRDIYKSFQYIAWKGKAHDELYVAGLTIDIPGGGKLTYPPGDTLRCELNEIAEGAVGPSLTNCNNTLFIAWKGHGSESMTVAPLDISDGNSGTPAGKPSYNPSKKYIIPNETTDGAPALAAFGEKLYIAWKGSGNDNLNIAPLKIHSDGTLSYDPSQKSPPLPDTSHVGPASAGFLATQIIA